MPVGESAVVSADVAQPTASRDVLVEREKTPLPWLVIETRAGAEGASIRTARPFVTLARAILWNPERKRHVAQFLFGLDPESGAPGPLDRPLSVRFVVTCDDVLPAQTRVKSIGPGGYGTVSVECSAAIKNERPEHELGIFVDRGNLRYPFQIPRRAGPPSLAADSNQLLGFGFSSATLTVSSVEEDGSPLARPSDTTFQLLAQGGRIDVSDVTVPGGQHQAKVAIHPHGLGAIEVVAAFGEQRSAPLTAEARLAAAAALGDFRRRPGRRLREHAAPEKPA